MEEFIKMLDEGYQLDDYRIKEKQIVFEISSQEKVLKCPYCGQKTSKVHSSYIREIQDLPMQNRKVILLVKTRKMFCLNQNCERKTFSERHRFADIKGKKTLRLEQNIIYTATQLSSVSASNVLKQNSIDVCKSSICALLKKNALSCG